MGVSHNVNANWSWQLLSRNDIDDRPWVAVSADNVAHAVWNDGKGVRHFVSTDSGKSWQERARIRDQGGSSHLAVGPDKEVAVRRGRLMPTLLMISDMVLSFRQPLRARSVISKGGTGDIMHRSRILLSIVLLMATSLANGDVVLEVAPEVRLLTEEADIIVTGAPPGAETTIEATLLDRGGRAWSSRGVFYAALDGTVNVARDASLDGTYTGVDAEGLFWSMLPVTVDELGAVSADNAEALEWPRWPDFDSWNADFSLRSTPVEIRFKAYITGALAGQAGKSAHNVQQIAFVAEGVKRTEIIEGDFRGVLFTPPGEGPFPVAMFVTGSGGGVYEGKAALLASHGFASLALAHFNYEGRPDNLINIPLEYFRDSMNWLSERFGQRRVAILGDSRGGEAVLIIASTYPEQVSAVVAGVPSNMVFAGCCDSDGEMGPAWTLGGEPLPYVSWSIHDARASDIWADSREARDIYRGAMTSIPMDDPRWIPVEKIKAPILFVSGEADAMWPSNIASDRSIERLDRLTFDYPYRHLEYKGAGHVVTFPMLVKSLADKTGKSPLGFSLTIGGVPDRNAFAQSDAFRQILEFLKTSHDFTVQ